MALDFQTCKPPVLCLRLMYGFYYERQILGNDKGNTSGADTHGETGTGPPTYLPRRETSHADEPLPSRPQRVENHFRAGFTPDPFARIFNNREWKSNHALEAP